MLGIEVDLVIAKAFRDPRGLGELVRIRPAKLQHDGLFVIAVSDQPLAITLPIPGNRSRPASG